MKKNALLLIVLAALLGIAFYVQKSRVKQLNTAAVKTREKVFPDLPVNDVRKIIIHEGGKQVTLTEGGGKWLIAERGGYPASNDKVQRALTSLHDLKIVDAKTVKKDARGGLKLLTTEEGQPFETGLQVDMFNDKGASLATIIIGKNVETTGGASSGSFNGPAEQRFVRVPTDGDTAWLVNDTVYDLQATPQEWLDKSFVNVVGLKDLTVTAPNLADSWAAQRQDEQSAFTLADPKVPGDELDTAKASGLPNLLSNATFTDVLTKDKATPDFMKGAIGARINTFDGFRYDIQLLEKKEPGANEAKYYLSTKVTAELAKERKAEPNEKPEDKKKLDDEFAAKKKEFEEKLAKEKAYDGWVYEMPNYVVSLLTKKRSEVLRDKVPPPSSPKIKLPEGATFVPAPAPAPTTAPEKPAPAPAPSPEAKPQTPAPAPAPTPEEKPAPAPETKGASPAPATAPASAPPAKSEAAPKPEEKKPATEEKK
jgi:hypothetical protein